MNFFFFKREILAVNKSTDEGGAHLRIARASDGCVLGLFKPRNVYNCSFKRVVMEDTLAMLDAYVK